MNPDKFDLCSPATLVYCSAAVCRCSCSSSQNSAAIWVPLYEPRKTFISNLRSKTCELMFTQHFSLAVSIKIYKNNHKTEIVVTWKEIEVECYWMVKAPPLKSSDLHFSVIKCHCRTYDDNIGPKLKKRSFAILGAYSILSRLIEDKGFIQLLKYYSLELLNL